MTRDQIKDLVIENTRRRDKESLILTAIAFALTEIGQVHDFKIMKQETDLAVTSGAASVAFPAEAIQLGELRFIDGLSSYPMTIGQKTSVVGRYPNVEAMSTGRPIEAYEDAGNLYLYPRPDAAYTLRVTYWRYSAALDNATDSPLYVHLDNAIVSWVTHYVYKSIQMYDDAKNWYASYTEAVRLAVQADRKKSGTEVRIEPFPGRPVQPIVEPYLDPFAQRDLDRRYW